MQGFIKAQQLDRQVYGVTALLLVVAALYILNLNRMIMYDEAYTLRHYANSPVNALLAYTLPNNHLLNSLAIWASTSIMGRSELAVRLPTMMWALLSVALIYRIARRLDGHNAGILAAAILATTLIFARYAVYARGYTLSILLTLAITEHLLFGQDRRRYGLLLYGMAVMMVMPSNALLVGAAGLWLLWQGRRAECIALAVGAVAGSMWYVPAWFLFWAGRDVVIGQTSPGMLINELIYLMRPTQALVLLLMAAVLGWISRPASALWRWVLLAVLVPLVLTPVQYWTTGSLFFARNYLYLLPLLAICAAIGAMVALRRQPGLSLFIALVVLQLPGINALSKPTLENALLEQVRATDETVVISCCIEEPIWYYMSQEPSERFMPVGDEFVVIVDRTFSTLESVLDLYQIEDVSCTPEDGWATEAWRCIRNDRTSTGG
jgi:hypothetical protein